MSDRKFAGETSVLAAYMLSDILLAIETALVRLQSSSSRTKDEKNDMKKRRDKRENVMVRWIDRQPAIHRPTEQAFNRPAILGQTEMTVSFEGRL